ncbi:hypothetical protein DSO57_1016013 [Entomophthora muscae]|uniref:Uncharacterized protein n=1 Tax=Entomophthora muscae TaxID=34485 RepID=A0ACC2TG44_9FUNG|nr:hypothetical protein DSO57_1016013 [Entomophthora muscae]
MDTKPQIAIVFYTTYLHTYHLAEAIREGAEKSGNCEIKLYQVPETLSPEELGNINAPTKPELPSITPELLKEADGILFGYPTRHGTLPAQLKELLDSCGGIWAEGALHGKMAGVFCSTSNQHGGHESSIMSLVTILTHFGLIFVPLGYNSPLLNEDAEMIGGSPWGASVIAGKDESRQPNEKELEIARIQVLSRYHGIHEPSQKKVDPELEDAVTDVPVAPVEAIPDSVPKRAPTSDDNKDGENNKAQGSASAPATESTSPQEPFQTTETIKKPKSTEITRGESSGAASGQSIKNVCSKESGPGNKTTSGLKKFFKRLSTRPKTGDGN